MFDKLITDAREATGRSTVKVYGHNVSDVSARNSILKRKAIPHRRKATDIVFSLQVPPHSAWSVELLADQFEPGHVVDEADAMLRPVWHVMLSAGNWKSIVELFLFVMVVGIG